MLSKSRVKRARRSSFAMITTSPGCNALYELGELGPIASRTGISANILVQLAAVNSAC
jgi:hypothetical protein